MIKQKLTVPLLMLAAAFTLAAPAVMPEANAKTIRLQTQQMSPVDDDEDDVLEFVIQNDTGYTIDSIYMSPSDDEDWGDDLMEQDVLEDGDTLVIEYDPELDDIAEWDLKVKWGEPHQDDPAEIWEDLDLGDVTSLTLHYDPDEDVTSATFNDVEEE